MRTRVTGKKARPATVALQARLLDAGMRLLANGLPASRLDAATVAREALTRPAQFKTAFPDPDDFLLALLKRLSEDVRAEAIQSIARKAPGPALIREGIQRYLDTVLQRPALLEISSMLQTHPGCHQITRDRRTSLVMLATLQLKMARVENAEGIGQLGMAMLFEIAQAEYEARRALPDYRHTIDSYFQWSGA